MIKFYAHRGIFDNKSVYENTLLAFQKAIDNDIGIELDVRLTKDDVVVVYHDPDLKKHFGVNIGVDELTYDELKAYTFKDELIPTFKEVLEFINKQVSIIVEIKPSPNNEKTAEAVAHLLDEYEGDFSVESFHPKVVRWFYKNRPHFKRGQLLMNKEDYDLKKDGWIMTSFITHLYTRPDFYAYEVRMGKNLLKRLFMNLMAKEIVSWTVKPNTNIYFKPDKIIFEDLKTIEIIDTLLPK